MGLLMLIYTICATRTNIIYVIIFASLVVLFSLLAAAYWHIGKGNEVLGNRLTVVSSCYDYPLNVDIFSRTFEYYLTLQFAGRRCCSFPS